MKFNEINEILQIKIKKSILYYDSNFKIKLLHKAYVNMNDSLELESIYCENNEILFENNKVYKINEIP